MKLLRSQRDGTCVITRDKNVLELHSLLTEPAPRHRVRNHPATCRQKSERVRKTWIPTTFLVISCSSLRFGQGASRDILRRSPPSQIDPTVRFWRRQRRACGKCGLQLNQRLLQLKRRPFEPFIWSTIKIQKHRSCQSPPETAWQYRRVGAKRPPSHRLKLGQSVTPEPIWLSRISASTAVWSLQMVHDLAAKRRISLRFTCDRHPSKSVLRCVRPQYRRRFRRLIRPSLDRHG